MEELNFLEPSINSIRKSIKGIDDSYNNFWDILAELIQNSVDAIKRANEEKGKIEIKIDCVNKEITVIDNGSGMQKEKIPNLLKPFSTDKERESVSIGEKGVGLKFVIFQSNDFHLRSNIGNGQSTIVEIIEAKNWKESISDTYPNATIGDKQEQFKGTEIKIGGIDNEDLFSLNFESMKYILRTKTAIGNTDFIWKEQLDYEIKLEMIDANGITKEEKIPYRYWLPIETVPKKGIIDLKEFKNWCQEDDRQDGQKRNKLKDKIIVYQDTIFHNGWREINYWACFVPKRGIWNEISQRDHLLTEAMIANEEIMYNKVFSSHQNGIYTSVKGMPTGIIIDHPNTGSAGYWANIFILFEDKNLKFDIGRKSINGNVKNIYKDHAKEIFAEFQKYISKYISGEPEIEATSQWNREEIFAEINQIVDLGNEKIPFKKNPSEQEASVAAIFYELIGMGKIPEIKPLLSGYRNKYDLYAKWGNHSLVIEFKSHLRNIVKDFSETTKLFDEVDYIVCWDVNDEDKIKLHDISLELEEVQDSVFSTSVKNYLPITTHKILLSASANPIYIIDLKQVLKEI